MKNNREKLTHAFEGLRGDTLREAVTAMETPVIKRNSARRFVAVTAACLAVVLALGAAVAVPLMRADELMVPDVTNTPPADMQPSLHYGEGIQVQMLSAGGNGDCFTPDPSDNVNINTQDLGIWHEFYFVFDGLEAGETLTLTSHNTTLAQAELRLRPEGIMGEIHNSPVHVIRPGEAEETEAETDASEKMDFEKMRVKAVTDYAQTLTYDPSLTDKDVPVFLWRYTHLSEESRADGHLYEDYVDFTIRNSEGHIAAVGSLYVGDQKLMSDENHYYYAALSVSRGALLGSVRFDDPTLVTDADVDALMEEFHNKAASQKNGLFDETTFSREEMGYKNLATVFTEYYPECTKTLELVIRSSSFDGNRGWKHMIISTIHEPEDTRDFFFFEDGTYAVAEEIKCICDYCGEVKILYHAFNQCEHDLSVVEHEYLHNINSIWLCYFTDGRIMKVENGETTFVTEDSIRA
ncbi:MAG: hypothetical protein E7661_06670 [Ruminococcaceae bacterium]|nr:hypothetical protein [Oscillospiraceae bacterium]